MLQSAAGDIHIAQDGASSYGMALAANMGANANFATYQIAKLLSQTGGT